jgi:drug/metabolite transporter (DMT)-like permease
VLVYAGLRTTTTVNAVLLNSSAPRFIMLCSWVIERDRATRGQIVGMLISLAGILIIMVRGEFAHLAQLQVHAGDAWVLLAMLVWGVYSVLLKRRPPELGGVLLLFLISVASVLLQAPVFLWSQWQAPMQMLAPPTMAGVLYVALAASVAAYICWNRAIAVVGANAAGVTLHLLPAFGTILAILLLDETFQGFHAAGITTILVGVVVATRAAPPRVAS